ncbi:MAG: hypothetical protein JJU41_05670 [Bacteroidetes bacterium]|nr:hypothetical protein [Bacteroidota bacterium]
MKRIASFFIPSIAALLLISACSSGHDHLDVNGFDVFLDNEIVVSQRGTTLTGNVSVNTGSTSPEMRVVFIDPDGAEMVITDSDYRLEVSSSNEDVLVANRTGLWTFTLQGISAGTAELSIGIMHGSHFDFESRPVPVSVVQTQQVSASN